MDTVDMEYLRWTQWKGDTPGKHCGLDTSGGHRTVDMGCIWRTKWTLRIQGGRSKDGILEVDTVDKGYYGVHNKDRILKVKTMYMEYSI
jgi:hypothetical protein